MKSLRILSLLCLIITCYYFSYYIYSGFHNPIPALGDSWDYHIPISKSIINGTFLHPHFNLVKQYYPGSAEAINSVFLVLNIPLTVSNIFAIAVLAVCCYKLARTFHLRLYFSLLFALTVVTTNAVMRWMNAVSIDVWVGVFFSLLLILLENPKKNFWYFFGLGICSGMLIGSKYTSFYYLLIFLPFYGKKIFEILNIPRIIAFIIPFFTLGIFWYLRNYLVVHNPVYPIILFGMPGVKGFGGYLTMYDSMWYIGLTHPMEMFSAAFGEYKLWLFSIFFIAFELIHQFFIKKKWFIDQSTRIYLLGIANFLLFLTYPTNTQTWIMVSSFRYSYPAYILLILGVFILAEKYKKEQMLGIVSFACMINVLSMAYYPKLILIYLPVALIIFYLFEHPQKAFFLPKNKKIIHKKTANSQSFS